MLRLLPWLWPAALLAQSAAPAPGSAPIAVNIQIDASHSLGELKPIWRFFGADEPNYATMKDGRKLIGELGQLRPKEVYFRAHNLLTSGDGTPALKWGSTNAYTEDSAGNPVYNWTIVDRIFDTYLERGVRPYAQVGFMPEALSVRPEPYQHEWRPGMKYDAIGTGWAYPPKDYARWSELVYQWARHCVQRYGAAEVEHWFWEIWNEPNGASYWHASPQEFYKLHDYAVAAIRRALPTARVGGPDVAGAGGAFMDGFLDHVVHGTNFATGERGTPTDFLSFHAKGQPRFVDGHVRLGISAQLGGMNTAFAKIAAIPELKTKPIVIGESDPDGCAACQGPQLGYRNTTMYSSYTAATIAREFMLADRHGVNLEGALTWAFEFEDQPYFAGQRVLASNGVDLPILNVFRMLSRMNGERVDTRSSGETPLAEIISRGVRGAPDIAAFSSLEPKKLNILVWYYHDDDLPGPDAAVRLTAQHLPFATGPARVVQYRIDQTHSNAFAEWRRMGSPAEPNEAQYARLIQAGQLAQLSESGIEDRVAEGFNALRALGRPSSPSTAEAVSPGTVNLELMLPRQAVSLLVLEWP